MRVGEYADQSGESTWVTPAEAFGKAMREYGDSLARIAFFLCGDQSRAEDLVADAYAAAWPKWSAGRIDDLGPYLRRIVDFRERTESSCRYPSRKCPEE